MARPSRAEIEAKVRADYEAREAEIKAGIQKGIQEMMPGIIAGLANQLIAQREALGPAASPESAPGTTSTVALLQGLAHEIARAGDPSNTRRIVPPDVLAKRAEARDAMVKSIVKFHAMGETPAYKVIRATFLNDVLIQPQYMDPATKRMVDQIIDWPGIPNQAMVPASDSATEVYQHYADSIGAMVGHMQVGFKKVDGRIEPDMVPHENLEAPLVLTGKEIRRGHPGVVEGAVAPALINDPRRGNPAAQPQTQNVLGTKAQPAVIS